MAIPNEPLTRGEQYLNRIATGEGKIPDEPLTRIEQYLNYIAENGGSGGGGGITPTMANALDAMFRVCAYDETKDYASAYQLFRLAFGLDDQPQPTPTQVSITSTLTHVTSTNPAVSGLTGASYYAVLSAESGYKMSAVTVTMNGTNVTASVYDSATGVISISSITGDIVITASATENTWETVTLNGVYVNLYGKGYTDNGETQLNTVKSGRSSSSPFAQNGIVRIQISNSSSASLYSFPFVGLSDTPITANAWNGNAVMVEDHTIQFTPGKSVDFEYNVSSGKYLVIYSTGNYAAMSDLTFDIQYKEA